MADTQQKSDQNFKRTPTGFLGPGQRHCLSYPARTGLVGWQGWAKGSRQDGAR